MPLYTALRRDGKPGEETLFLSIDEMEQWEVDNPEWEIQCGAPLLHSGAGLGLKTAKPDQHFKDKMKTIRKANPGNTLDNYTKY